MAANPSIPDEKESVMTIMAENRQEELAPVVDGGPEGKVGEKVSVYSPERDVLDGAGRLKAAPAEKAAEVNLVYIKSKDRLLELATATGFVDRDVRQVDAALAAKREEISDAKALIPAAQVMPDIEELLVQAGMGDVEAEKRIAKLKKEHTICQRIASEKEAKILEEVKPLEAQLAALERHASKLYRNLSVLQGETREATVTFLRAEAERLSLEYLEAGAIVEDRLFRITNIGDTLRSGFSVPCVFGQELRRLIIPSLGTEAANTDPPDRFTTRRSSLFGILADDELYRLDQVEDVQLEEFRTLGLELSLPPSPARLTREAPPRVKGPRAVEPDYRGDSAPCHLVRPDPADDLPKFAAKAADQEVFS